MRTKIVLQSELPSKCLKDAPKEEISINSQYLIRGGFVSRLMGGVYSYLPLGLRVLQKIEDIVRDEMNKIGAHEVFMPAITPKSQWEATGRWEMMQDIMYPVKDGDRTYGLAPTHEEIIAPLVGASINSYKDLPKYAYQIQTKFRNEPRAKSGLLRGREFRMKDMYSFNIKEEELDRFYETAIEAYHNVYKRCGIGEQTFLTFASGGVFCKFSHEFQAITSSGEDTIYLNREKEIAVNDEVMHEPEVKDDLGINKDNTEEVRAIEVGNIFKLGTKYTDAFKVQAADADGKLQPIHMGCYGIGTSRVMGAVVEICNDENGIIWPQEIAPFDAHFIVIGKDDAVLNDAKVVADEFAEAGFEVMVDDRKMSPGQKFAESDLIGIPYRVILSPKLQEKGNVEIKNRKTGEIVEVAMTEVTAKFIELVG